MSKAEKIKKDILEKVKDYYKENFSDEKFISPIIKIVITTINLLKSDTTIDLSKSDVREFTGLEWTEFRKKCLKVTEK